MKDHTPRTRKIRNTGLTVDRINLRQERQISTALPEIHPIQDKKHLAHPAQGRVGSHLPEDTPSNTLSILSNLAHKLERGRNL